MAQKMDEYKKAAILLAICSGTINRTRACQEYEISDDDFSLWEKAFNEDGIAGLKDRRLSARRREQADTSL